MLHRSSLRLRRNWRTNSPENSRDFVIDRFRSKDGSDRCDYLMAGALPNSKGRCDTPNSRSTKASTGSGKHDRSVFTNPALATYNNAITVDGTMETFSQNSAPNAGIHTLQPSRPVAVSLPTELIQHIFTYLGPFDFNAAR